MVANGFYRIPSLPFIFPFIEIYLFQISKYKNMCNGFFPRREEKILNNPYFFCIYSDKMYLYLWEDPVSKDVSISLRRSCK